jgi:hypothetical protein
MAELTPEERKKIFEEEKAKMEAQMKAQEEWKQENPEPNKKAKDGLVLSLGSILVGFLLGIPAIVYGIQGLRYAEEYPNAGGRGLSLFNVTVGALTTIVSILLTIHFLSQ